MNSTILFLCPHGAAKSVMACAYFNRLVQQHGLPLVGDAAGTHPDEVVSPLVVKMLKSEGMDVANHQPRRVSHDDLTQAQRVISIGCALEDLDIPLERVEQWHDVPMVSQDADGAREAIRTHVEALVADLRAARY
jgi:protein-tyrosine-phosphatase